MSPGAIACPSHSSDTPVTMLRRALSFPAMLSASLIALAVLTVRHRFNDPDLWWHLRMGQVMWTGGVIPSTDFLSFTTGQHAWVPHEWLSQLGIYSAFRAGDYFGLMLLFCALTGALLALQYASCWMYSGNAKVAFLGALATWFFATTGLAIRPQLLGYLLLACELLLLQLGRMRDRRWFFLLPALFALWVNVHGSFFFGIAVLAATLICGLREGRAGLVVARALSEPQRKALVWSGAASLPALFANPVGWPVVAYPLRTLFDGRMQLDAVAEWQSLSFDDFRAFGLLGVAAAILFVALIRRSVLYLDEIVLLAMALTMAVLHQRLLFAWGIVAAPILCRQIADLWDGYDPQRDHIVPNAAMIAAALAAAIVAFPSRAGMIAQVERGNPVQAVEFLRRSHFSGRIFNEYTYGGYLSWALPEQKVFIDGRADVYAWTGVLADYGELVTLRKDPEEILNRYGVDLCLLPRQAPLARVLPYLAGWSERYSDSQAVIFVRSPQYRSDISWTRP